MRFRPRLFVVSMVVALVVGVAGGWGVYQLAADDPVDAVLSVPGEYVLPAEDGPALAGLGFPDVVLTDPDGDEVRSGDLIGTPLVVNVWFSTCPPCERELADFAEVHAELGERVRFVGVNPFDRPDTMVSFAAERGVTYELLRDPESAFLDAIELTSFPRTLFVDAGGAIVGEAGELDADGLRRLIEELL